MGNCCARPTVSVNLTDPTPFIDERNAHMMRLSKVMHLKKRSPFIDAPFAKSLSSTSLGSLLNKPSIDYLQSLGVDTVEPSGVVIGEHASFLFVLHVPVQVELPSQYLSHDALRQSPHYMAPGKFEIHVLNLENGTVDELHGIAHVNPFTMDPRSPAVLSMRPDGTFERFGWFVYRITFGNPLSQKGPIMEADPRTAPNMVNFCVISHYVKFGFDYTMLTGDAPLAAGTNVGTATRSRPVNIEMPSASLLANQNVV